MTVDQLVPGKQCCRCAEFRPFTEYLQRGRLCARCRAADAAPRVSEADWQNTVVDALNTFGWAHMHVRRSVGKGRKWTTATSSDGWPDLVAFRGPHVLGIELKADDGSATDEQLEWLARFARVVGGRAWVVKPSDPAWDIFVRWLRDPASAPRRHGW